jgi:GDPmannose 4,6-dehydratase
MTRPPRALITGITGQDGQLLAELLLSKGYEVAGFGRRQSILACKTLDKHRDRLHFMYGDLADAVSIAAAIQDFAPTELYNLAGQSAPGMSWTLAVETGETAGLGALKIYEAARRLQPQCRIYQASSSEMYGDVLASPQNESTPFKPMNPYAASKVYAHQLAEIYRRSYGMFVSCGILFNHESPLRPMRFLTQKVAYGAACAKRGVMNSSLLNEEGEPIVRNGKLSLGNLDASRDWGYAGDYVQAMWLMLQQAQAEDFVIGTGTWRTVRDLVACAYAHVGLDWRDFVVTDARFVRPTETGPTVADASKARTQLGWQPTVSFEAMIAEMVDAQLAAMP